MKIWFSLLIAIALSSCSEESSEMNDVDIVTDTEKVDFNTMVKRHVEANLEIQANEDYTLEIYKHKLNEDNLEDAVILVNRKAKAIQEAENARNTPQRASTGYMGNYNFVFYYDGAKDRVTQPIPIASSAIHPLKVSFRPVQTEGYDDFIVEHRIKDAGFTSFFTVKSSTPFMVFQWKTYDYLNTPKQECIYLGIGEGSISLAKDILVYEGKFNGKLPTMIEPMEAKIENTGKLLYRFFYDPKQGKYATRDKAIEN